MSRFKKFIDDEPEEFCPEVFEMYINCKMLIFESINWHNTKIEVIENNSNKFKCLFSCDNLNYYLIMRHFTNNIWIAEYDLSGSSNMDRTIYSRLKSKEIHNGVYAAVIKCFSEFIKTVHPNKIIFSSSDERLITFYDKRFKNVLIKELPLEFEKKNINDNGSVAWLYKVIGE